MKIVNMETKRRIVKLYSAGFKAKLLSADFGVSKGFVYSLASDAKRNPDKYAEIAEETTKDDHVVMTVLRYPSEFRAKIVEERRNGKTLRELSKEYGVSPASICNWCRAARKADTLIETFKPTSVETASTETERLISENNALRAALAALLRIPA